MTRLDVHRIHAGGVYSNQQIRGAQGWDTNIRHAHEVIASVSVNECDLHGARLTDRQPGTAKLVAVRDAEHDALRLAERRRVEERNHRRRVCRGAVFGRVSTSPCVMFGVPCRHVRGQ